MQIEIESVFKIQGYLVYIINITIKDIIKNNIIKIIL